MKIRLLTILVSMLLVLSACGGEEPTPTPVPPTATTAPTETPVPPTETPEPPTATPEPTEEPVEEAEPTEVPVEEAEPTEVPVEEAEPTEVAIEEPAPAGDFDTSGFVELESPEGGFSLLHPEGWVAEGLFGFYVLASDPALLEADSTPEDGVIMLAIGAPSEEFEGQSADEIIDELISEFTPAADAEDVTIVSGPDEITINDQDAVTLTVTGDAEDGAEVTVVLTIVFGETQAAFLIGVTPSTVADQYLDTIAAVTSTVSVFESTIDLEDLGDGLLLEDVDVTEVGPIAVGDSQSGSLAQGETAGYTFSATADTPVDIVVEGGADFDLTLDVLDADGFSILPFGRVDGGFSGDPEVASEVTFPADGDYVIAVGGFAGAAGDYTVTVYPAGEAPLESTDSSFEFGGSEMTEAGVIAVDENVNGSVALNETVGWAFSATTDTSVDIVVEASGNFDVTLDVYDADGFSILPTGRVDSGFSGEPEVAAEVAFPADGEYTIVVTGFGGGSGDYVLTVYPAGESPVEPTTNAFNFANEPTILAGPVSLDEPVRGDLPGGELVGWTFAVDEATTIEITVEPEEGFDPVVDVLDSNGFSILPNGEVDDAIGTEVLSGVELPAADEYTILIRGFASSGGVYSLTVTAE